MNSVNKVIVVMSNCGTDLTIILFVGTTVLKGETYLLAFEALVLAVTRGSIVERNEH
jgi:hypothetical protein